MDAAEVSGIPLVFTAGSPARGSLIGATLVTGAGLIVRAAAAEVVGPENSVDGPVKVVSEDYSLFLQQVPGCYYFVGSRNPDRGLIWGHHHNKFDIDEDAMAIGVETMTRTVLRYFDETARR